MKIHVLRLKPGQDLKEELIKFTNNNNIKAGFIKSCVGSLKQAILRYADGKLTQKHEEPFEITSLVGTLCLDDVHLHMSIANREGKVTGGHVKEGCIVYTTAEIIIGESLQHIFSRKFDSETGFDELKINKL
tara:strand:+ start:152 stop:547 length:396 start_codon:yes stop_codon:yes gene_type:complete